MRLSGIRIGPRKRLAAVALAIGLGVFAVVVQVLGLNWGMLLLAAGMGITLMAVAWIMVDLRRQQRLMVGHLGRVEALHRKLDELGEEGLNSAELGRLYEALEQQQLLTGELKTLITGLSDGLRRIHYSQHRTQAGQVWVQAEMQRQRNCRHRQCRVVVFPVRIHDYRIEGSFDWPAARQGSNRYYRWENE